MSASYWVLVSEELMDSDPRWAEAGLHPVEPGNYEYPGMRWWKFDDDNAPEAFTGKRIELTVSLQDGKPVITERAVL